MDRLYRVDAPAAPFIGKEENGLAVFRAVPFGVAKRWERAVFPEDSLTPIDATGPSIDPIQPTGKHELQREDIIYMNIYLNPCYEGKRAVLLDVPVGGGVNSRGWSTDPSRFVREHPEILVVVANARVGVISSLNLTEFPDYEEKYRFSCNLTKTDFLLAMQWVKRNIEAFGGDPDNVTLTGHSYGSTVTNSMFLMPEAEGYFHKAIPRSCYCIDTNMLMGRQESLYAAKVFREVTGIGTIKEALEIPALKTLEIQKEMVAGMKSGVADGDFPGALCPPFCTVIDNAIIFDDYFEQLKKTAAKVPILTGTTSGDGDARYDFLGDPEANLRDLKVRCYDKMDPARGGVHGDEVIAAYLESHGGDALMAYADLNGDLGMRKNAIAAAEVFSRLGTVYMYYYDYYVERPDKKRAAHGSAENAAWGMRSETPDYMALTIRDCYASFIKYGDPNVENRSYEASKDPDPRNIYKEPLCWKPYSHEHPWTMVYSRDRISLQEGVRTQDAQTMLKIVKEYPEIMKL